MLSVEMQHHLVLDILSNATQMMRVGDKRVENVLLEPATQVMFYLHTVRDQMLPCDSMNLDGIDEEIWCMTEQRIAAEELGREIDHANAMLIDAYSEIEEQDPCNYILQPRDEYEERGLVPFYSDEGWTV